jgi:hypothetical protein
VHLLVDTISKTRTTPHHKDTTWSRIKPIGPMTPAGGGGPATWLFSVRFCALGAGGILYYMQAPRGRRRRYEICVVPFTACFRGPKWPGGEMHEVAPQAGGGGVRSYVAVRSTCCLDSARLAQTDSARARGARAHARALLHWQGLRFSELVRTKLRTPRHLGLGLAGFVFVVCCGVLFLMPKWLFCT